MKRGYTECRFGQLHFIHANGSSGGAEKPALVMLHQNPSSSVEYEPLIVEMAKDRDVIAFDTPGNGMSDWPDGPQELAMYAAAFADGLSALKIWQARPVDVFGFHTGSLLAAELAIAEPDRVGRVVVSGIPFRTPEQRQERLDEIEARARLSDDGQDILKQISNLWDYIVTQRDPRVPLERAARIFVEKMKPLDRSWWPYRAVWLYEFNERFPLISQPTLILQPHEKLLEYSRRAAEFISNVQFVELPDLRRDVFDVDAPKIAEAMRKFLV